MAIYLWNVRWGLIFRIIPVTITNYQTRRFIFKLKFCIFLLKVEINKYNYVLELDPKMLDICIVETLTSTNRVSGQPGREYIQLLKTYVNIRKLFNQFAVSQVKNIFKFMKTKWAVRKAEKTKYIHYQISILISCFFY